jgi:uncharacterized protein YunC (DUF1805 family)
LVKVMPIQIDGHTFIATEVRLPKTNLLTVHCDSGYVMCGALDVELLRTKLASRGVLAARAVGVKTMEELLAGTVESCTQEAEARGIHKGMPVQEALLRMTAASD